MRLLDFYVRHRATGDQAGFALGLTFLVFFAGPVVAAASILGTAPGPASQRNSGRERLARFVVALILTGGAAFLVWFQASVRRLQALDLPPGQVPSPEATWYGFLASALLIAFALGLAGCAVAVVSATAWRSGWFRMVLLVVGFAAAAAVAGIVVTSGPTSLILAVPAGALLFAVAWTVRSSGRADPNEPVPG
jgi:hypothetical protein